MAEHLHVKVSGDGEKPLVLLHGLFGSGNNLGQLARGLQSLFRVYSVDLPDHGRSEWLKDASVDAYAQRVTSWLDAEGIQETVVLGHSLGGKVAMQLALSRPELVSHLIVLDIAPITYQPSHDLVFSALRGVLEAKVVNRGQAKIVLAEHLKETRVADFLLSSAQISGENLVTWRFNLTGLERGYEKLLASLSVGAGEFERFDRPALMLKGANSDYVPEDAKKQFEDLFSSLTVLTVEGAGHWLHQEQTVVVVDLIRQFLRG